LNCRFAVNGIQKASRLLVVTCVCGMLASLAKSNASYHPSGSAQARPIAPADHFIYENAARFS
jgi:hypothetical protein